MPTPECCGTTTVPGVELFSLPPCFQSSECWEWDNPALTAPAGQIRGRPRFHPFSPVYCRDDADGQGIDVRLSGEPALVEEANLADSTCLTQNNSLRRVRGLDGEVSLTGLPLGTNVCVQECQGSCNFIAEGVTGDEQPGCAALQTATVTNDGCWPMKLDICVDICGAEMFNVGQDDQTAIYVGRFTVNGVETDCRVFGVSGTENGTGNEFRAYNAYSGRVCLPFVTLAPGDTYTVTFQPFVTFRTGQSPTTTNVTLGQRCLSITGTSIIDAETIAALEAS